MTRYLPALNRPRWALVSIGVLILLLVESVSASEVWIDRVFANLKRMEEGDAKNSAIGFTVKHLLEVGAASEALVLAEELEETDPSLHLQALALGLGFGPFDVELSDESRERVSSSYSAQRKRIEAANDQMLKNAAAYLQKNPGVDVSGEVEQQRFRLGGALAKLIASVWTIQSATGGVLEPGLDVALEELENYSSTRRNLNNEVLRPALAQFGNPAALRRRLLAHRVETLPSMKEIASLISNTNESTDAIFDLESVFRDCSTLAVEARDLGDRELSAMLRGRFSAMRELLSDDLFDSIQSIERNLHGSTSEDRMEDLSDMSSGTDTIDDVWLAASYFDERLAEQGLDQWSAEDWLRIEPFFRHQAIEHRVEDTVMELSPEELASLMSQVEGSEFEGSETALVRHWLACLVATTHASRDEVSAAEKALVFARELSESTVFQLNDRQQIHAEELQGYRNRFEENPDLSSEEATDRRNRFEETLKQLAEEQAESLTSVGSEIHLKAQTVAAIAVEGTDSALQFLKLAPQLSDTTRTMLLASGFAIGGHDEQLDRSYSRLIRSIEGVTFALGALHGLKWRE